MSEPAPGMMVTSNVRLLRPLGRGGMGSVWVAEHVSLRTNVVVKFMARELADSQEALARFSREAAAASQVKSPHVVQMLDHGVGVDGRPYIVMELLEGHDLEQRLAAGTALPPGEVDAVVSQLARALSKAHERGIVHRDVKPSNVFLLDAGGGELFVKLLDFGIAKAPEGGIAGGTTRTGSFVGSPFYMSPEQVVGDKQIDHRTDLWSLGVVAYEALTGAKPFYAETVGALALKIHRDPLPIPSRVNPALPPAVDAWFAQACARDPAGRFGSARDMSDALARALSRAAGAPSSRREGEPGSARTVAFEPARGVRGLERSESSDDAPERLAPQSLPRASDARSETLGAGGVVTHGPSKAASRGRWWLAGGAGVAIAAVVALVPRWTTGAPTPRGGALETPRSSATAKGPAGPVSPGRAAAVVAVPTALETATLVETSEPTVTPRPEAPVRPSHRAPSRPSALSAPPAPSGSARPGAATPSASPVPGTDDDIK
ncbi:MAG TPA: protein kinase [Polyangiaceae bacterium]|nr:protein kinase [Polyangiaceae bacterium]